MTTSLDVSLIVTTYERPANLVRTLASVACQTGVDDRFELIVADDGSTDDTPRVVGDFAQSVPFSVKYVTHPHNGFHAARVRNEGAEAALSPYLVFLDGDCFIEPNHLQCHLRLRRPRHVWFGYPMILDQKTSEQIASDTITSGRYRQIIPRKERIRNRLRSWKANLCSQLRHPNRPRLRSTNIGIWRSDFEGVNGFDENFHGWGYEDDDFGQRLRLAGLRIGCISHRAPCYHIWHPREISATQIDNSNLRYHLRANRASHCENGLRKSLHVA